MASSLEKMNPGDLPEEGDKDENTDDNEGPSSGYDREFLKKYFSKALGISNEPPPERVLEEVTLEGVAKYISSDKCKNIITMAGAGISTSAGIPDFRSKETGVYNNLEKFNLPNPTAIFDIDYFKENPVPYYTVRKTLFTTTYKPTVCHYFIKMLADKGKLLRHYTQNIDGLDKIAGIGDDKIVQAHGTFQTSHCLKCERKYMLKWMKESIFSEPDGVPRCEGCRGVVRPDTVFYGEELPAYFGECVKRDFDNCDMLIIVGTSLVVQPFASLTSRVPETCPRLYINLEKTNMGGTHPLTTLIFGGGFAFDSDDNYRDVFKQSTCDEGCQELADLLGWGEELKILVKTQHEELDKQMAQTPKSTVNKTGSVKYPAKAVAPKTISKTPIKSPVKSGSVTATPGKSKQTRVSASKVGTKPKPGFTVTAKNSA